MSQPLPLAWVDKIFHKLTLVYGRDFVGRWEGLELADVKTDWGYELSGFENWPEAIAHALANLPAGKPPTALEFRDLARKAPRKEFIALPGPAADPERVAAELKKLTAITGKGITPGRIDHKAWARRLQAREAAGEILNLTVSRFAREALATERNFAAQ